MEHYKENQKRHWLEQLEYAEKLRANAIAFLAKLALEEAKDKGEIDE